MKLLAFAALFVVGVTLSPPIEAKCARNVAVPVILTTRDTELPDDGGVLVGWDASMDDATGEMSADPSDQPTWTATESQPKSQTKLALTRVALAPGLSVYKVTGTGDVTLAGKKPLGTFHHDPKAAANTMAAPALTSMVFVKQKVVRWAERTATAHFKSAPPAAAAAVIVYSVTAKGNTPIGFATLPDTHDTLTEVDTFHDRGHCDVILDAARPPTPGEKIVVAWVDSFGRLSPTSKPVTTH
jgi:hypothetical protein